ncbi:MAG: pyridoxamine 5'-phosphate oxidase family protein [Desulfobacterales bacterium]|jgi:nitroimidazol reductase NimA-like FMN-containing flavoprotein (pyridoxamine 5'-phosphate oxidase superfamily)
MAQDQEIKDQIRELFTNQKLGVLSTHHSGQPYASLIAFVGNRDLKEICFVTSRTTRKFANLSADPRVAILINSSLNMESDFHDAVSVTALGNAKEIHGSEKDEILRLYLTKHPYLEAFATSPTCAVVGVTITTYVIVKNFQQVMELHIDQ